MLTENTQDDEEATISTRWKGKENSEAWTKSEAFRESHSKTEAV